MIWTTKNGQRLTITQMTDAHLRNARAQLLREADAANAEALECLAYCGGDMAEYYAHGASDELLTRATNLRIAAELMERELRSRGMQVQP